MTAIDFSDILSDLRRRCNGVMTATVGLGHIFDDETHQGVLQLIDDLLTHIERLERAFDSERILAATK